MSDKLLRDQAMTLFFAGHETTSGALTWMWYLLSRNPEVETRLHEEITGGVGDGPITVEALGQLPYLEMVVKESMRILPSVWTYMREPQEDIWLGGYFIPKGATVMISPYVTQHDARFFEDPEVFRPERFSPENQARIPAGARMA